MLKSFASESVKPNTLFFTRSDCVAKSSVALATSSKAAASAKVRRKVTFLSKDSATLTVSLSAALPTSFASDSERLVVSAFAAENKLAKSSVTLVESSFAKDVSRTSESVSVGVSALARPTSCTSSSVTVGASEKEVSNSFASSSVTEVVSSLPKAVSKEVIASERAGASVKSRTYCMTLLNSSVSVELSASALSTALDKTSVSRKCNSTY